MNIVETVGHDLKVAGEAVVHETVIPVEFLIKAEAVIASAIQDQPTIKSAVVELVKQAQGVIGDVATASASKGLNLASDAKALGDAEAFFENFKNTFIPLIEQAYSEVAVDVA